jgi:sugar fermentation stimulation protein A
MTVQFSTALHRGRLLKRYKRFLADVQLDDGTIVTAHCPNTGSMKSCYEENGLVWLSFNPDPKRKLSYTWEFSETEGGLIGINTSKPNAVIAEGITSGRIVELAGYKNLRQEVKYGKNSRIDILLEDPARGSCYVEVKNTTLLEGRGVLFPDAVTERGLKHLEELEKTVAMGHRAVMVYFINRPEGDFFTSADAIDPKYGKALRTAVNRGVEVIAVRAKSSVTSITVGESVPVKL